MDPRIDLIIENLKEVFDPEIPVNVYDLGLIYSVDMEGDEAKILMTLTAPGCPAALARERSKIGAESTNALPRHMEISVRMKTKSSLSFSFTTKW